MLRSLALTLTLTLVTASAGLAYAHEKWFSGVVAHTQWPSALTPPNLWFVLTAVILAVIAYALWRARGHRGLLPGPELFGAVDWRRSALYGLVPAILGIHLAVPLLMFGTSGHLFAPNVDLAGPWRYLLGLAQTGIALSLFYGGFARTAALALAALWLLGFWVATPEAMLENTHILGFAAFFYLAGRGPLSIDRLIFPKLEPPAILMRYAVPALRIGAGISFIVVAFTEKLANLPLALSFLEHYHLNFMPAFGLPLPDATFILAAGAVELFIGLLLVSGMFVREVILLAWLPFNLTLTIFNWVELVGHLPFYGIMAVLLVWQPGSHNRQLWLRGLRDGPLPVELPKAQRGSTRPEG